jgi:hypothetical protein
MKKNIYIYGLLTVLMVGGFLFVEDNKPKKINWRESYVSRHKIPYGTRVYKELITEAWGDRLTETYRSPYEILWEEHMEGTYVFFNDYISFDEEELNALLEWVDEGNRLFLASEIVPVILLDTLNIGIDRIYKADRFDPVFKYDLVAKELSEETALWSRAYSKDYFKKIDSSTTKILGTLTLTNDSTLLNQPKVNFIKTRFGQGEILLCTAPEAFTNYFILEGNNLEYTSGISSYFAQDEHIYLDAYYKSGKTVEVSPMRIFLDTKEFKWAYYLCLIGILLYVIFQGKRKQRAVPVIPPLTNQSLNFTRTVGDMYYETHQRRSIAEHRIEFFLEYIRSNFYLPTENIDAAFIQQLAARSQHTPQQIEELFRFIDRIQKAPSLSDPLLEQLEKRIENFKAQAHGIQ